MESGLRANELRTLTVGNCHLDEYPPVLTVKASFSKHRREDTQPIPPELARILAEYIKGREADEAVFRNMPDSDRTAKMLRKDLEAAGIAYVDAGGRFADFQALRHTYATNLAKGGATPKESMDLARHANINLTMATYSHTLITDRAAALKALPDLSSKPQRTHTQRATGTCDAVAERAEIEGDTTSRTTSRKREACNALPLNKIGELSSGDGVGWRAIVFPACNQPRQVDPGKSGCSVQDFHARDSVLFVGSVRSWSNTQGPGEFAGSALAVHLYSELF